ncbi:MAG: glucokinase [Proteobacteria bacterium]|nr:glucokinase [Pseudomonadota bacterium]
MILAGDLGGTNLRFALVESPAAVPRFKHSYPAAEVTGIEAALEAFLAAAQAPSVSAARLRVAGPVSDGRVHMTNLGWSLDAASLGARFALPRLRLINDFDAAARGIAHLAPTACAVLQDGTPVQDAPRLLIGAGTGLGVAFLVHGTTGYQPLPGEGGHAAFAPTDAAQAGLWQHLHARFGRVTLEHVLSGAGLERVYGYLAARGEIAESAALRAALRGTASQAAAITRHDLDHGDPLALAALDLYLSCYGACAGDLALTVLARGGVFVAGGIAPTLLRRIQRGGFMAAFNDKASFAEHARRMPVAVVTDPLLGLRGAAAAALEH